MDIKAPGVVKLLGEHAVVYGKLSVAVAISLYATASVTDSNSDSIMISLPDMKEKYAINGQELERLRSGYRSTDINEFAKAEGKRYGKVLPFAVVAARLYKEGVAVLGKAVTVTSEIPIGSGLASSAACSTAFAVALISSGGRHLQDDAIIDIARDGERVAHRNPGAGAIDVSASFYGGVVSFDRLGGARREQVNALPELVLIDTGPKLSTAVTVGRVSEHYKNERGWTERILEEINRCSTMGLAALKDGRFKSLGALMYEDHDCLRKLDVSSPALDKAVEIGKSIGAFGVKLSGGGGGGIAIAIGNNTEEIVDAMKNAGFVPSIASVSEKGAKSYMKNGHTYQ